MPLSGVGFTDPPPLYLHVDQSGAERRSTGKSASEELPLEVLTVSKNELKHLFLCICITIDETTEKHDGILGPRKWIYVQSCIYLLPGWSLQVANLTNHWRKTLRCVRDSAVAQTTNPIDDDMPWSTSPGDPLSSSQFYRDTGSFLLQDRPMMKGI
jgi:hypothetical protein